MIDDLCDLITNGKRASKREHRLLHLEGNVYGVLAAPSYVSSL
jgi:hypothetical protein